MSDKLIVRWKSNWADEMDIEGFKIVDVDEFDKWSEKMRSHDESLEICIGTNEYIDYENGQELLSDLAIKPISDEYAKIIEQYVGHRLGFTEGILYNI